MKEVPLTLINTSKISMNDPQKDLDDLDGFLFFSNKIQYN